MLTIYQQYLYALSSVYVYSNVTLLLTGPVACTMPRNMRWVYFYAVYANLLKVSIFLLGSKRPSILFLVDTSMSELAHIFSLYIFVIICAHF